MSRVRLVAALGLVAASAAAADARAEPTVWGATASPRARAESQAIREIDLLVGKSRNVVQLSPLRRGLALHFLEEAGAETTTTPMIAFLYGDLLRLTGERERALPYLEIAAASGPVLLRVDALESQGYAFARLDRAIEEAAVFQRALDFSVDAWTRADLLANQAEAYMASGDLRQAIAGYRASIDCLRGPELVLAVTAFWGLAVALDRSGATTDALHTIGIARQYDPMDRSLSDEQWTFSPEYDAAWYRALGALLRARTASATSDRVVAYRAAIDGFIDYLKHAPPEGPYVEIARKRVELLEAEVLTLPEPPTTAAR
ncbi:MAG: hypothetical protein U0414_01335 [Polyangiaceae bacterium]